MRAGMPGAAALLRRVTASPAAQAGRRGCSALHQWRPTAPRRSAAAAAARQAGAEPSDPPAYDAAWATQQAAVMALASAVLGPLCDGQHSAHDVLHYVAPSHLSLPALGFELETCWWVPALFGAAGVVLGVGHPLLDAQPWADAPRHGADPPWPWVLAGIAAFVGQYAASGGLEGPLLGAGLAGLPALDALLAATGVLHWAAFDGTRQGLGLAVATALGGPAVEIALINGLHLYAYTRPELLGVPTWIPWVYFCGSAAVGNLGRRVSSELLRRRRRPGG